jgi:FkbM family methyltransferase
MRDNHVQDEDNISFSLISRLLFLFFLLIFGSRFTAFQANVIIVPFPQGRTVSSWRLSSTVKPIPCSGLACTVLQQVRQRFKNEAWYECSNLFDNYYREALSRNDYSSSSSLDWILTVGYVSRILGGQFPAEPPIQTPFLRKQHEYVMKNEVKRKYPDYHGLYEAGSWTRHHGLRNASQQVKDFVKDKEIFDVGAYTGDSVMVLENYTNIRVRSYELIPETASMAQSYAEKMNRAKHIVNNIGLSDKPGFINVPRRGNIGSSIRSRGPVTVRLTTIDAEVRAYNLTIGFIKIDIEGYECDVLNGAKSTLKTQHPILSLSSYHNIELMDIPKFLEEIGGYRIEFENQGYNMGNMYEQVILAYPVWLPSHQKWIKRISCNR